MGKNLKKMMYNFNKVLQEELTNDRDIFDSLFIIRDVWKELYAEYKNKTTK